MNIMFKEKILFMTGEGRDITNPPTVLSGGGWLKELREQIGVLYHVITSNEALSTNDFIFIGEPSLATLSFIERAKKAFIFSLESPLYCEHSKNFFSLYHNNPKICKYSFADFSFPSFSSQICKEAINTSKERLLRKTVKDQSRLRCCLIAANKFRGQFTHKYDYLNLRSYIGFIKNEKWQRCMRGNFGARLDAIIQISDCSHLDIYGKNWDYFLPLHFKKNIHICGLVADKLQTLRQYDFSLCFENYKYPRYVTEKIPQSIICGVLPIIKKGTIVNQIPRALFYEWDGGTFEYIKLRNKLEEFKNFYLSEDIELIMQPYTSEFFSSKIFRELTK
jgi:hypothetical protein